MHTDLSRRLAELPPVQAAPIGEGDHHRRAKPDWIADEEDEFVASIPHLRSMAEDGRRDEMVLMFERVNAKRREGALSPVEFRAKIMDRAGSRFSVVDLLKRASAFRDDECWTGQGPETTFCPAEIYAFYLNHRRSPVDDLRERFSAVDSIGRMSGMADRCRELAVEFRWITPLSECLPREHPMPDEMRRGVLRNGGITERGGQGSFLKWFAGWLDEAAHRLQRPATKRGPNEKEAAFQIDWFVEATRRAGANRDVVWEVGRRLFLITFPGRGNRYTFTPNYRRAVERRLRSVGII